MTSKRTRKMHAIEILATYGAIASAVKFARRDRHRKNGAQSSKCAVSNADGVA
jgi:hypothetical protein